MRILDIVNMGSLFFLEEQGTTTAKALLNYLRRKGVGRFSTTQIRFSFDRLSILLISMEAGCHPSLLSSKLN
jgi:hypothetical protein